MARCDVLIVGAGPTGLVLALWLTKLGVRVRIVDRTEAPGTTSRALAVQARTLELYRQLDLAEAVVERGHKVPAVNLWTRGERAARLAFEHIGERLTRFAFLEIFPQDEHERLLIERLQQLGVAVERRTELTGFTDEGESITARLRTAGGQEESCVAQYLAGCDGARSLVRDTLGTGFPGGTYRQVFYVADIQGAGPAVDGELHVDLDEADFLAVFPLAGTGRARLIGTVRDERAAHPESLRFEDISSRAMQQLQLVVQQVNWFSTYHVHHRVTGRFVIGRVFLLGDAAHIHSPVGGQGMNTGIGDAVNLAWKLATVLQGRGHESVLDSYEQERIGFARELVKTTDQAFTNVTSSSPMARLVRLRIAPLVIPPLLSSKAARRVMFRRVSQTGIDYEGSSLSTGWTETVQGGDRLPWIQNANGSGEDNFAPLRSLDWQVHVYGEPTNELQQLCATRKLPLHVYSWRKQMRCTGLWQNAAYLVRPDGYVGLADAVGSATAVSSYLDRLSIRMI